MDRPSGVVSREVRSEGNVFIMFSTHQFSHTWLEIDSLTSYFTQNGTNYASKDKVTVCRFKKRYHWSKTCILCFYHQIPRLSADTWARPPPPCWHHMTLHIIIKSTKTLTRENYLETCLCNVLGGHPYISWRQNCQFPLLTVSRHFCQTPTFCN